MIYNDDCTVPNEYLEQLSEVHQSKRKCREMEITYLFGIDRVKTG